MKRKTIEAHIERVMKLIHDMADDSAIKAELERTIIDVYHRGMQNQYRNEHRWP